MRNLFGVTRPGQTIFTASDIGWVVGHGFIVYAPLLVGAATVLYEGKPIGTPNAGSFWRIIEEYNVNALFCAPSALRAISSHDPQAEQLNSRNLTSLHGLFLAGERSEPTIITRYQKLLPNTKIIDNWWSSESGSPMTGVFLNSSQKIKPGSAGPPLPGWDLRIVDDDGNEVPRGQMGNIVLAPPLAPTGFTSLFRQEERYWAGYYQRFKGKWVDTGDAGVLDEDNFLTVLSRTDDLLNVAAHRLSTASIEGAACMAEGVKEVYVVGVKDELKGEAPMGFIVAGDDENLKQRVNEAVRREVGPIAGLKAVVRIPAGAVPRTRSGKVLRRAFRSLTVGEVVVPEGVEDGVWKDVAKEVNRVLGVPAGKAKL
jgi:propionyl-CoA synthetase